MRRGRTGLGHLHAGQPHPLEHLHKVAFPHWSIWATLPPEAIVMLGLCCHRGLGWGPWSCFSQSVLMSMVCVTTEGHVHIHGLYCNLQPCWCLWAVLPWGPYWYECPVLSPEAIVMPGPVLPLRALSGSVDLLQPGLEVSPETMWRPVIQLSSDCKEQRNYFCSVINDCRCIVEKERHGWLLGQPLPSSHILPAK